MITDQDVARYERDGYIVVPDVLSAQDIADLRRVTDEFVERSRSTQQHTDVFDLERATTLSSRACAASRPRTSTIRCMSAWSATLASWPC